MSRHNDKPQHERGDMDTTEVQMQAHSQLLERERIKAEVSYRELADLASRELMRGRRRHGESSISYQRVYQLCTGQGAGYTSFAKANALAKVLHSNTEYLFTEHAHERKSND